MKTLLPGALLIALSACASVTEPPVRVPMDLSSGRPVVDLTLNGQGPFPFVLDTGAGAFVVRTSTFEQLDLKISGETTISSPGGAPVPVSETAIDSVEIAGIALGGVDALYFERGSMMDNLGAGVFGPVFLKDAGRTYFDFIDYELELGGAFITPEDGNWIPFGESAPLLDVTLLLNALEIPARLDSGSPGVVSVPQEITDELPLDGDVTVVGQARTVDRAFDILEAQMHQTLSVGDADIPLEKIRIFDREVANVGMGAMHGLTLEIDWDNERFALAGTAKPKAPRRRMVRQAANDQNSSGKTAQLEARVEKCIAEYAASTDFTGALEIISEGNTLATYVSGSSALDDAPNVLNTPFNSASVGKMFLAVSIGQLVDQGRLSFDDPVGTYVPELPEDLAQITIAQLLSHTSGLGNIMQTASRTQLMEAKTARDLLPALMRESLSFEPGTDWAYSNSGFVLLGVALEAVTGQSYRSYISENVFSIAGMSETYFDPPATLTVGLTSMSPTGQRFNQPVLPEMYGRPAIPAGGYFTTVGDLNRFLLALSAGNLVTAETLQTMTKAHHQSERAGRRRAYGYGFAVDSDSGRYGHSGGTGGANAEARIAADGSWAMSILSNMDPLAATELAQRLETVLDQDAAPYSCS